MYSVINSYDTKKCQFDTNIYSEKVFENKYIYGPLSIKFPLLFEITAQNKHNIDYKNLINKAYNYYSQIYDINKNFELLINNNDFKKDTQILHIAIHHSAEYRIQELEDIINSNNIYKELFEVEMYELKMLSDVSDKVISLIYNNNLNEDRNNKVNYLQFLLNEINKLVIKI